MTSTSDERTALLLTLQGIRSSAAWRLAAPLRWLESRFPEATRAASAAASVLVSALALRLPADLHIWRQMRLIRRSGLFDAAWYIGKHPEVAELGDDPVEHWLRKGLTRGFAPHPLFDPVHYLTSNPDVAQAGVNPLLHYAGQGAWEGRAPHPLFDSNWYLEHNPEVAKNRADPLLDYLTRGAADGQDPHPLFDSTWYLRTYRQRVSSGENPLVHYVTCGAALGCDPCPRFDSDAYLEAHPELADSGENPLAHYLASGGHPTGPDENGQPATPAARLGDAELIAAAEQSVKSLISAGGGTAAAGMVDPGGELLPKLIAFYLPQFHPIPENDAWWGRGFTEWANVARARPSYDGHYQPQLPTDFGFYDLRLPEILDQQAEAARAHGVYGFCFYHYWFNGRRLLERPVEQMLARGQPHMPFCLCWANENWTRRWDGREQQILLAQTYGQGWAERFIRDLLPALRDERYIRVDDAPLLLIYRADLLPSTLEVTDRWREIAQTEAGLELHLAAVQSFDIDDPRPMGFDAAVEFPPHKDRFAVHREKIPGLDPHFRGLLGDYLAMRDHLLAKPMPDYIWYRAAAPSWDNSARRGRKAMVLLGSSPKVYANWLRLLVLQTLARTEAQEPLVFVNAWNEWAEGTHLEPDDKYGHAWLDSTRDALCDGTRDYRLAKGLRSEREDILQALLALTRGNA